jgi:transposase
MLAYQGRSAVEIAAVGCRSRGTIEHVLRRFRRGGLAALLPYDGQRRDGTFVSPRSG